MFEKQWSQASDRLHQLSKDCSATNTDIPVFKVKTLNALVDYVLAEPAASPQPVHHKFVLIDEVAKTCASDPLPSVIDLVHIFRRALDTANIFDMWHLAFIEAFYCQFRLGERLSSGPSVDLIELIFKSLQNHSFSNENSNTEIQNKWQNFLSKRMFSTCTTDSNALNAEQTVLAMRSTFQQLYR